MRKMRKSLIPWLLPMAVLLVAAPAQAAGWFACGNLSQIGWSCQLGGYPSSSYEYGVKYTTVEPQAVSCTYWNYGMRIHNKLPYFVMSDNPESGMRWGGFVFYTGTTASDDDTCSGGTWRHRYWYMDQNNAISTPWGNGCYGNNLTIYCRAR